MVSTVGARFSYAPTAEGLKQRRMQAVSLQRRAIGVRAEGGINPEIRKAEEKVVDSIVVADLSKPVTAYCRY